MSDTSRWLALDVFCSRETVDIVEEALGTLDSLGIETDLLAKQTAEPIRVTAYFHELPEEATVAAALNGIDVRKVERREIVETDWLAEWKKHWRATNVGRFIIAPPWEAVHEDGLVIRIEPNMAFGTGTHATTQLCLGAISKLYRSGQSFLDVGCGTGILSIAAALLAGTDVPSPVIIGFDTDTKSVEIARENAVLNGVSRLTEFRHGSIGDEMPRFDFVCANVTLDVILPMLGLLLEKTVETLVLSGILAEQRNEIEAALEEQGAEGDIEQSGEWISVTVAA
jgi:ribosomal protein L11 methyltransferase